jgi:hypothetical protein
MPFQKRLTVDFYQVAMPDGAPEFGRLLREVIHLSARQRNAMVRDRHLRLQVLDSWHRCLEGEMIRIRMDDIPAIADLDGTIDALDLPESKGVGESAAFLYDPSTNVLAIQRNMHGVSAGACAGYFEQFVRTEGFIELEPVMKEDEYRKLRSIDRARHLEVNIAHAHDARLRQGGGSTTDYARLAANYDAESIKVTISAGRSHKASLNTGRVVQDVRRLFGITREDNKTITKLVVSGRGAGDEVIFLDLLKGRLKTAIALDAGDYRTIPYDFRRGVVRQAFTAERDELSRRFGAAQRQQNDAER